MHRNFAVGITFKKTEVLLSALIGLTILGDVVSLPALAAIVLGLVGVLALSDPPQASGPLLTRVLNKGTALGLMSGFMFGLSVNGYRGASLSIGDGDVLYRAIINLAFVTAFQTAVLAIWLIWKERGEILRALRAWRVAGAGRGHIHDRIAVLVHGVHVAKRGLCKDAWPDRAVVFPADRAVCVWRDHRATGMAGAADS